MVWPARRRVFVMPRVWARRIGRGEMVGEAIFDEDRVVLNCCLVRLVAIGSEGWEGGLFGVAFLVRVR
jgi:hypothetical protein